MYIHVYVYPCTCIWKYHICWVLKVFGRKKGGGVGVDSCVTLPIVRQSRVVLCSCCWNKKQTCARFESYGPWPNSNCAHCLPSQALLSLKKFVDWGHQPLKGQTVSQSLPIFATLWCLYKELYTACPPCSWSTYSTYDSNILEISSVRLL